MHLKAPFTEEQICNLIKKGLNYNLSNIDIGHILAPKFHISLNRFVILLKKAKEEKHISCEDDYGYMFKVDEDNVKKKI